MALLKVLLLYVCVLFASTNGFTETPGVIHGSCSSGDDSLKIISFLDFVNGIVTEAKQMVQNSRNNYSYDLHKPMDCADVIDGKNKSSGVHKIWPRSRVVEGPVQVMCDMKDDGGGWTVIQRRGDFNSSADYFYRDWSSYKNGFGEIRKDFWLGNDIIFTLTNQRACSIKFVLTDWEGSTTYARYDDFWVDDENQDYTLHVNGYRGTAGDSFTAHNGAPFTTKDRKNDVHSSNCALEFKGAWWYKACHESNLNGQYLKGPHESFANGVNWKAFREYRYSLKDTYMKIRPKNFDKFGDAE